MSGLRPLVDLIEKEPYSVILKNYVAIGLPVNLFKHSQPIRPLQIQVLQHPQVQILNQRRSPIHQI